MFFFSFWKNEIIFLLELHFDPTNKNKSNYFDKYILKQTLNHFLLIASSIQRRLICQRPLHSQPVKVSPTNFVGFIVEYDLAAEYPYCFETVETKFQNTR